MKSEQSNGTNLRWIGPLASLLIFGVVAFLLHRELAHLHTHEILHELRHTPRMHVLIAFGFTAASYWLLGFYDFLGLRYIVRAVAYPRVLLTSFIANAFGHNLGLAAFTGAAVRFRLYASAGLTAIDVATVQGFCSLTIGLALATLGGLSLALEPTQTAMVLHLHPRWAMLGGILLLAWVLAYATWCILGRAPIEIRGWALRPPPPTLGLTQIALGVCDLSCATAVLWWVLPPQAQISYLSFLGVYAGAVTAGIISHVPGGLGVFEAVVVFALRDVPASALLGSLLVYRAVYYLAPLMAATLLFGAKELAAERGPLARAHAFASFYIGPVVPQVAGTLTFLAGFILLLSGATPTLDARLTVLRQFLPLAILELSHLAGSVIGLGLLVLSRALFRRVQAAYHISFWLLAAGIAASLLKGLDFEEATILAIVLVVLVLGRRAFYRPTSILEEPFTPIWAVSIAGVIATAIWVSFLAFRHIEFSHDLWWTFAMDANASRTLRATFLVVVLATAFLLLNGLQPARPEPGVADVEDLEHARRIIATSDCTMANAALSGDKRLLFGDDGDAFVMYQVAGRSWIALGDPIGPPPRAEELVWRFREVSDHHGGRTVFYQASADCLPLYIDLGLAALKIGEEARVPLEDFSLEGAARADLRQAWRRAERDGASFEVIAPERIAEVLPELRRISDSWLTRKSVAEKRFSVGAFSEDYIRNFDTVLVRSEGNISAFANLWHTNSKEELSIDLMRFGPDAPRGAMDYMFIELMLWGRAQGYRWFNLGMAPLAGLERHPLAPAWHRVGNFVFRHGEHFYNFDGLRRYKSKFGPAWEPKYLVAPGGIALPRILVDVSVLISGGVKELFAR
ncbi:MAG TPA: bifunctional lysylphosphatidylglycerol flippase/synthetase MprF [Steroidobacteraceae bacterium]|jgi:phosphatidylglycerol lysyltransferase